MIDADDRIGLLIGDRYRLLERLGAGGFGHVWRAHDETLRIDVAVKEVRLSPGLTRQEHAERLERAEREARNAARLRDHPNVVAVHDVVVQDGVPWTIMQLIPGRTLEAQLDERGPLRPADAALVARALLSALKAAHAAGIVHRDVKPANVMLTPDREVVLTDFGLAVAQADTSLTASGSVMGSMEYLAPERAEGRDGMPASDLFSLGATLYQAVEGFSPFRRETATATLKAVLLDEPPQPRHAGPLAPLIKGLLLKDPRQRLGIDQALGMLEAISASWSGSGLVSGSGSASASGSRSVSGSGSGLGSAPMDPGRAGRSGARSHSGQPLTRSPQSQVTATVPTRAVPLPSAPARRAAGGAWSKAMPWAMAVAGLIVAVVVSACTRQAVHSYHNPLRTLSKPAPTVLPGILVGTVVFWVLAAIAADRLRPSGTRSVPRRSAQFAGYGFSTIALLLAVVGASSYVHKTTAFNELMSKEPRGPWSEAHAASVAWLLPLFAVVFLIVYWNVEAAGRAATVNAASPRRAGRR